MKKKLYLDCEKNQKEDLPIGKSLASGVEIYVKGVPLFKKLQEGKGGRGWSKNRQK